MKTKILGLRTTIYKVPDRMRKLFCSIMFLGSGAGVAFAQNPGDSLFNSSIVHDINITFSQANFWDSLMYYKQHADSFNLSTQSMMGNVYVDGTLVDSVGVTLKGNSSFGYPGQKKPIKIKFDDFVSTKKYDGLKTIDLNNNVLDPTYMREKLMLDFLNSKGLYAPRCTYTKVSYNGQYVGLYKVVEQVDKVFLNSRIGNKSGNLFKGDPMGSLTWMGPADSSYYGFYELKTNTIANNWSDLVHLIDKINNTPAVNFKDSVDAVFNAQPFIKQWAAENLFVDLDNYFNAPHNYYLYHNAASQKFDWITWDVSVVFGFYPFQTQAQTESTNILSSNFPLTTNMLADPVYKTDYLDALCAYLPDFSNAALDPKIDSLANVIYPYLVAEPDSNQMFPEQIFYFCLDTFTLHTPMGDIPPLKEFISNRRSNVLNQLASLPYTCTVGIRQIANAPGLEIYPNPFSYETRAQIDGDLGGITLTFYNSLGLPVKQIKDVHGREVVFARNGLPAGVYYITLEKDNKLIHTRKIVVTD